MNKFKEVFRQDMARYKNKPEMYIRLLLYFLRKVQTTNNNVLRLVYRVFYRLVASSRGLEISPTTQIGVGLYLGHAYSITINSRTVIGNNCNLHKGIVIGQQNRGRLKGTPTIGNNVWIGINAAIVGKITIGDDVLIAPNSFVNCDVPSHSVVFGNPCIIKHRDYATEGYINQILDV